MSKACEREFFLLPTPLRRRYMGARLSQSQSLSHSLRQTITLPSIFAPLFASVLVSSQRELERFLMGYGAHEVLKPPKGRKTWAALLYASYRKARGEGNLLRRMADSKIGSVDIVVAQEPVSIRKTARGFEVSNYGESLERVSQKLLVKDFEPSVKKQIEHLCRFISSAMDMKRKILNYALMHQAAFVRSGNVLDIRPLLQKDVAAGVGADIGNVSRVLSSVKLYYGRRAIKSLHLVPGNKYGKVVLSELMSRILKKEKRKLSDEEMSRILNERYQKFLVAMGGRIARRTVTKHKPRKSRKRRGR